MCVSAVVFVLLGSYETVFNRTKKTFKGMVIQSLNTSVDLVFFFFAKLSLIIVSCHVYHLIDQ